MAQTFPFPRGPGGNPPPEYSRLRRECPVTKAPIHDGHIWLISKMDDCKKVLTDDRFSKVRTHPGFPELRPGAKAAVEGREPTFVDMDPPDHTRFRGMFAHGFTPEAVEAMRPRIQAIADELADELAKGGKPADLQESFSMPLAMKVIYEHLGIPFKDYKFLSGNVAVRSSGSSTARDAAAAQEELNKYMEALVDEKIKSPAQDLLSQVVERELKPGHITRPQLVAHAFLLLVAGNATVASMINLGLLELLRHPDQLAALKADLPGLLPGAVAESCRYHTASAQALRRVALQDVELGGQTIKEGEGIIALNQSANRDEGVFKDPDAFDIRRAPNPHIAYGWGTHECVAMPLANVELECAFRALLTRLPEIQLAVPYEQLEWNEPTADVGLKKMPIAW